jgi:hypothetical protein
MNGHQEDSKTPWVAGGRAVAHERSRKIGTSLFPRRPPPQICQQLTSPHPVLARVMLPSHPPAPHGHTCCVAAVPAPIAGSPTPLYSRVIYCPARGVITAPFEAQAGLAVPPSLTALEVRPLPPIPSNANNVMPTCVVPSTGPQRRLPPRRSTPTFPHCPPPTSPK